MNSSPLPIAEVTLVAYLGGGLVAIHEALDTTIDVLTAPHGEKVDRLAVEQPSAVLSILAQSGYRPIGGNEFAHPTERAGVWPPKWRVACPRAGADGHLVETMWDELSNAGFRAGDSRFFDVASRIAFQLRASSVRLRDLCVAYSRQLNAHYFMHGPSSQDWFEDRNSTAVRLAAHSAFTDLHIALDYLAEFTGCYLFRPAIAIDSWSGLVKALRKRKPTGDPLLSKQIHEMSDESVNSAGWCAELTKYRNVFLHTAPLGLVQGWDASLAYQTRMRSGQLVPMLKCPLPGNVLRFDKSKRPQFSYAHPSKLKELLLALREEAENAPDALEYIHKAYLRLVEFAGEVGSRSPLEPLPLILTDADLAERGDS